jgi:hypothetical protein
LNESAQASSQPTFLRLSTRRLYPLTLRRLGARRAPRRRRVRGAGADGV